MALSEEPRVGARRKLTGREETLLVAVACSDPPAGRARWTLELLADEMVQRTEHEELSRETVRRRLAEQSVKPWQRKMWCIGGVRSVSPPDADERPVLRAPRWRRGVSARRPPARKGAQPGVAGQRGLRGTLESTNDALGALHADAPVQDSPQLLDPSLAHRRGRPRVEHDGDPRSQVLDERRCVRFTAHSAESARTVS